MAAPHHLWRTRRQQNVAAARAAVPPGAGRVVPAWRDITPTEREVIEALARCSFLPGSRDKRVVRFAASSPRLTVRGAAYLAVLRHRYRRQIPASVPWLTGAEAAVTQVPIVNPSPDAEAP